MIDGSIKIIGDLDRDEDRQLCMEPVFPKYCIWTSFAVSTGGLYVGIRITVTDLNDNIPTWHERSILLRFREESQEVIKTELPVANDPDLDLNGIQDYRLKGNERYIDMFKLEVIKNAHSGTSPLEDISPKFRLYLEVVGSLDRETEALYNLTLLAYDGAQPYHTGTLQIVIEVLDENDHAPQFISQSYVATVSEDVVVGTEIHLTGINSTDNQADSVADYSPSTSTRILMKTNRLIATDRDAGANGRVEYNFATATDPSVFYTFHLDKHTGVIRVAQPLSFDTGPREWNFHVLATDLGRPARSSSTLVKIQLNDANTHGPEIKMRIQPPKAYAVRIEQAKKSGLISSLDPQVLYIPENSPPIVEPLALFTVSDKDTGPGGIFRCYIDEAHTPESVPPVNISQTLSQTSLAGHFELNFTATLPNWKVYSLFVLRPIDREAIQKSDLFITCEDQGYPSRKSFVHLTVFLIDENDNAPKFTQNHYRIHILEGNRPNISAGKVVAVDTDDGENGRVTYKIEWPSEEKLQANSKNNDWLRIDDHGKLIVSQTLDREASPNGFRFKVTAVDNGTPIRLNSTADVELIVDDLNDCTPTFTENQYNFTIPEDFGQSFVSERYVGTVKAIDCDLGINAAVTYSILDPGLPFGITGGGILKTTRLVDREIRSIYRLTVLARDGAADIVTVGDHESHTRSANNYLASKRVTQLEHKVRTSAAQVWITVVDVNDHHPVFVHPNSSHYQIPVSVHEEKNFLLTRMVAIDKDNGANGKIRYKLLSQPSSDLFEIRGETGELFIKNRMDSSHLGTLLLTIEASDQGIPPQSNNVTVEIKIVDALPTGQTKQTGQRLSLIGLDDMGSDGADRTGAIEINKLIIMCIIISTTVICFIMVVSIALFVRRNPCCRSIFPLQSQNHLSQTDQCNARWDEGEEGEEKRLSEEGTEFKITAQSVADAGTKAPATVCVCSHDPTISNRYAEFLRFHSPNRHVYNGDFNRLQADPSGCHFLARNRMLCENAASLGSLNGLASCLLERANLLSLATPHRLYDHRSSSFLDKKIPSLKRVL
ncbi:hypothetical protein PHET_00840 [Paragonimus heterotremus]|uniref:Cadherin domain-containing protein n=1 Tax=Paragonimus heterotremus TaxID=100268 RepID=A0A8J4SU71_9TREM|nr:hypothetical protein PHET_00840 [Paragonimus heterotremus]